MATGKNVTMGLIIAWAVLACSCAFQPTVGSTSGGDKNDQQDGTESDDGGLDVPGEDALEGPADLGGTSDFCPSGNGLYCGNNPNVNLTTGVLYRCEYGVYTEHRTCTGDCRVAPAGMNDYCE